MKTSRPGILDPIGRAKFDAWNKRKDLSEEDAKRLYVDSLVKVRRDLDSAAHTADDESRIAQILRNYRDDSQAVALIRELENFTSDHPRDLVRSGHSLTDTRATAGRQRSSTSRGSSEDESEESDASSSSVPPASLGPYISKSQLPAPVEIQQPPSERRAPDSVQGGPSGRGRGRTPRRGDTYQTTEEDEDSTTESVDRSLIPPSRSAASRGYPASQSGTGARLPPPPPLPLPPHPGQLRPHSLVAAGGSSYGQTARLPPGMYSGVSTPAGSGTPLPVGGARYPPSTGYNAPPSASGGAPWAQGQLPPIPPSRYRPPGSDYATGGLQPVLSAPPIPTAPSPGVGAVGRDTRSLEQALD